jgi:tRNA-specific 2-thiouridylase
MTPTRSSSVIVALSGGVDSSLAAAFLKDQGWAVKAVHFLLPGTERIRERKLETAARVADHLEVCFQVLDLQERFEKRVIAPFETAYLEGRTPNPCVVCNPEVKLDALLDLADTSGMSCVATGHYARVKPVGHEEAALFRGKDRAKEQSYFLHRLEPRHLRRVVFPLGEWTKEEARIEAHTRGLPSRAEPESQEICFLSGGDYRSFLRSRRGEEIESPGDIVDRDGRKLGTHKGTHRYTIGQRRGLGVASSRPYYVLALHPRLNQVVVGRREDLLRSDVEAEDVVWVAGQPGDEKSRAEAQIRYRHAAAEGLLEILSPHRVRFVFDHAQPAVTPGQALVLYQGERVLGGGWIVS